MRLVLFHSSFTACGGAELLALGQARDLAAAGVDVHILTFGLDPARWEGAMGDLPVTVVPKRHWSDLPFAVDRRLQMGRRGARAERVLRTLAPDVVLAHNPPVQAMLGQAEIPARKLWYCHEPSRSLFPGDTCRQVLGLAAAGSLSPELDAWARKRLVQEARPGWDCRRGRAFDRAGVQGLHSIAVNSAYTGESLHRVYGRPADHIFPPTLPMGPLPERRGLHRGGLQVLVQTRLELLKNVDTVLKGFAAARPRLGASPCLHVVGRGEAQPHLEALAASLGLGESVRFHGFLPQEELEALRRSCDVFACLPWDEPFGMVFPEAAADGLLLVGPDHGGPSEILDGGRLGWCLPPQCPERLEEAFCEIWQLSDAEVDARRASTHEACVVRYAPEAVLPRFRDWVQG